LKLSSSRALMMGFVVALLVFCGVAWLNWHHISQMQETADWVNHTQTVREKLARLLLQLEDIQSGARGFVLAGDQVFLEPFHDAVVGVKGQFQEVRSLTRDNPEQQKESEMLEKLIDQEVAFAQRLVQVRQDTGFEPARQLVASGQGAVLMDDIRSVIAVMDAKERNLLEQRSLLARREARNAVIFTAVGTTLCFMVLGSVFTLMVQENRLRRKSQHELTASNRELAVALRANQLIMEHSLDVICTIDEEGKFVFLSAACERVWGYLPEELRGQKYIDLVLPEDVAKTNEAAASIMAGQRLRDFENRYRRKDGTVIPVVWSATWSQEDRLMFCVAHDVTKRKADEERILKLNRDLQSRSNELESANKELEAFSYSVSHDLRAPLRHIHGYVEMLTSSASSQLSEKSLRYLKVITDASMEMGQLIDDLLAFSRMGRIEVHESVVSLNGCVQDTVRGLEMATKDRNIIWKVPPLPPVQGDAAMIKQVFSNLLGNAVKYSRQRDPAVIEIGQAGEEDGRIIFFVRDNGAGFDMKYGHKLFGVFQRLHRADEFEGTGIGLATVRRIISRHGGRTWAEGEKDKGATFYFTLKAETAESQTPYGSEVSYQE
jgi:PAS domain S-box-containing protein